jgi:hypothetical protein
LVENGFPPDTCGNDGKMSITYNIKVPSVQRIPNIQIDLFRIGQYVRRRGNLSHVQPFPVHEILIKSPGYILALILQSENKGQSDKRQEDDLLRIIIFKKEECYEQGIERQTQHGDRK